MLIILILAVMLPWGLFFVPSIVMILLGAIHSTYPTVPNLSFKITWFACAIVFALSTYFKGTDKVRKVNKKRKDKKPKGIFSPYTETKSI